MSPSPQTREPWWCRAYRLALHALPADFRDQWGDDMRATFAERVREAQRTRGGTPWRLLAREFRNALSVGLHERLDSNTRDFRMIYWQDIRYAFRLLARSPGFALLTVIVLAGGLGLSTFTFSFLHTAMIRPLPLHDGERIVRLFAMDEGRSRPVDVVDLAALRASSGTLRDIGGYDKREVLLGRDGDRRVVMTAVTDPVLFKVAQTPALFGRTLLPADADDGAEPVIVLSYRTWEVAFGANRAALDSRVVVNGVNTRVVGVMPEGFGFPVAEEAWLPLPSSVERSVQADKQYLSVFARLAPGVNSAQAVTEATALLRRSLAARNATSQDTSRAARSAISVESFPEAQIGEERVLLFAFLNFLAALILVLALVNVVTLLGARANERVRETAVRLALGASTGRLIMQSMWEGVILCIAAGVVGTAGAAWGLDAITRWTRAHMEGNMAFWWVWEMDRVTVLSAGAFSTVAIAVLGCVVSLRAMRTNVREVMQDGSARSGSRREGRLARMLVATQVATVTILMFVGVLSGVMARRVVNLDPGYDAAKLLQVSLEPSTERFPTDDARAAVFRGAQARLSEHAAIDVALLRAKLADRGDRGAFSIRETHTTRALPTASVVATLGNLSTLGISVLQGRAVEASDDRTRAPVVLISRSLAAQHWHGQSPVGQQLRLAGVGDTVQWRTIVGVVTDLPYGNILARDRNTDAIYIPLLQSGVSEADVVVRYRSNEMAGRQALFDVFGTIDPLQIPDYVNRTSEVLEKSALIATGLTKLFGGCFAFALLLAVAGTYGLMSRSIGLRTREIGVRRALGATDAIATRMLLTQGARQVGVGTLAAAPIVAIVGAAATQYLPLGGVLATMTGLFVSVAITAVVVAATWLPTRRVLRLPLRDALWRE